MSERDLLALVVFVVVVLLVVANAVAPVQPLQAPRDVKVEVRQ